MEKNITKNQAQVISRIVSRYEKYTNYDEEQTPQENLEKHVLYYSSVLDIYKKTDMKELKPFLESVHQSLLLKVDILKGFIYEEDSIKLSKKLDMLKQMDELKEQINKIGVEKNDM